MDYGRIVRDISDGLLTIGKDGTIYDLNPAARAMLGLSRDYTGEKYYMLMDENHSAANDSFHQMILDALGEKDQLHRREAPYVLPDGTRKLLEVSASAMKREDSEQLSILLSFSDRTEENRLRQRVEDSTVFFIGLLCALCGWNYIYAIWEYLGQPVGTGVLSKVMILLLLIPLLLCRKHMHLSPESMGLRIRGKGKFILQDSLIMMAGVGMLCGVKLIIMRRNPGFFDASLPFFRWNKYPLTEYLTYALSVVLQEVLSRGVVHELLRRMMPGRNVEFTAILMSSVLFGALHIQLGLVYMLCAAMLLGILGVIFIRQKSIWGLSIIHYALGMIFGILDFVVY